MTLYCDSSALIKLYIAEAHSAAVQARVGAATMVVTAAVAFVEVRAAFGRMRRERRLTTGELATVRRQFGEDWNSILQIRGDDEVIAEAARLAELHGLRALDGIHLASFQQVLERTDDEIEFVAFDGRLNRAARKLR